MKRFTGIFVVAAALAMCLAASGCAGDTGSIDSAITVSATATAQVVPDKASLSMTTSATGKTSDEARAAGEAAANNIADALREVGVSGDEIEIGEVELTERMGVASGEIIDGYEDEFGNWIDVYEEAPGVVGYDAKVKITTDGFDADRLEQAVRDAAKAGATGFSDLMFWVSNRDEAYQQALDQAVEAAHAKAESLASAGGVYVGHVVNLVEGESSTFEDVIVGDASKLDPKSESSMNVAPDAIDVEASVTVSYAIS